MICKPCRSPILVREVQPPHIYVRGDGRLKLSKQSTTYQYNLPLSPQTLVLCFRCPATSPRFRRRSKTEPWSGQARPGSTNRRRLPQTGLPEGLGRLVSKAPAYCLAYRAGSRPPAGRVVEFSPGTAGTRGRVRVTRFERNTLFGDSAGEFRSKIGQQ